jgi:hypothetical protein
MVGVALNEVNILRSWKRRVISEFYVNKAVTCVKLLLPADNLLSQFWRVGVGERRQTGDLCLEWAPPRPPLSSEVPIPSLRFLS